MLRLPLKENPLYEFFCVEDLANWRNLPLFPRALNSAREYLRAEKAARSACMLCLRATGEVWLVKVGKRGGWSKLWNFGDPLSYA